MAWKKARLPIFLLTLCLLVISIWAMPGSGRCTTRRNAAWLGVEWTSASSEAAVNSLARLHAAHGVGDIYVYTAFLRSDGQFSSTGDNLAKFVSAYRHNNPAVQIMAWIGIPLQRKNSIGVDGWVDLSNLNTRQRIVGYIKDIIQKADLDGVHLDVETVWDGDQNFIQLLREIRAELKPGLLVSIAGAHWMPPIAARLPIIGKFRWSSAYYGRVAEVTDQIALMAYDSYLPSAALYRLWVREQTTGIRKSLASKNIDLIIGVSASNVRASSHNPNAETISSGIAGMCDSRERYATQPYPGIGIYAAWDANENDWQNLSRFTPGY
jgi:hypothetical protein